MEFQSALIYIKNGERMTRDKWKDDTDTVHMELYHKDKGGTLYSRCLLRDHVPYFPSQEDIFADDWVFASD